MATNELIAGPRKAKKLNAVSILLDSGVEAIFIFDEPEWNALRRYTCFYPAEYNGQYIIVARDHTSGSAASAFGVIFDEIGATTYAVLMASPGLASQLQGTKRSA